MVSMQLIYALFLLSFTHSRFHTLSMLSRSKRGGIGLSDGIGIGDGNVMQSELTPHRTVSVHRRNKRDRNTSSILRNGHRRNHGHHRRPRHHEGALNVVVPSKPPPPRRGNVKYPRTVMIAGHWWTRCHSKEERKYFWTLDDGTNSTSSWDPWTESGGKAPWIRPSARRWNKFKDDEQRPYWYDYQTKHSTYSRPNDYESEEVIEYDSDPTAVLDQ